MATNFTKTFAVEKVGISITEKRLMDFMKKIQSAEEERLQSWLATWSTERYWTLESMKPLPSLIIFLAVILPSFYFDESINPLNVKSMQQETKIAPFRNLRLLKKGIFSVLYEIFKEIILECRYTVSIATEFDFSYKICYYYYLLNYIL